MHRQHGLISQTYIYDVPNMQIDSGRPDLVFGISAHQPPSSPVPPVTFSLQVLSPSEVPALQGLCIHPLAIAGNQRSMRGRRSRDSLLPALQHSPRFPMRRLLSPTILTPSGDVQNFKACDRSIYTLPSRLSFYAIVSQLSIHTIVLIEHPFPTNLDIFHPRFDRSTSFRFSGSQ
jgi:hypothetical protein